MSEENFNPSKKERTILMLSVVGVLTLIVAIAGATYAFFQINAEGVGIGGTAATIDVDVDVTLSSTAATGKMVPQLDSAIQSAVTGTANGSCVDGNGNTVCKVYTITVTNNSTSNVSLNGKLTLTAATMQNLKWTSGTSATAGFDGANAHAKNYVALTNSAVSLAPNGSATYYVVVWISETKTNQNTTDYGEFSGTVTFESAAGDGVTSTIISE